MAQAIELLCWASGGQIAGRIATAFPPLVAGIFLALCLVYLLKTRFEEDLMAKSVGFVFLILGCCT